MKQNKSEKQEALTFASIHSSHVVEELGQIQMIFADKTGTLTCNEMKMKKISIAGESYSTLPFSHSEFIFIFQMI